MRNLFVFGLAAVCAVMVAGNALATEKDGGGHGGGNDNGKDSDKYCVYVKNTDYYYGMACWIKEKNNYGSKHMTYGDLRKQTVYVDPYSKGHSKKLKKGYYDCWLFYSHDLHGYDHQYVSEYDLKNRKIDSKQVHLHKGDVYLYCDRGGFHNGHGGGEPH